METFYALLVLSVGKPPVTGVFPSQRPVTWSFDVFLDIRLMAASSNDRDAGDLKRRVIYCDVIVMMCMQFYTRANYIFDQLNAKEPYPMNVPKLIVTMCVLLCSACLYFCGDFSIFVRLYSDSPNSIYIYIYIYCIPRVMTFDFNYWIKWLRPWYFLANHVSYTTTEVRKLS